MNPHPPAPSPARSLPPFPGPHPPAPSPAPSLPTSPGEGGKSQNISSPSLPVREGRRDRETKFSCLSPPLPVRGEGRGRETKFSCLSPPLSVRGEGRGRETKFSCLSPPLSVRGEGRGRETKFSCLSPPLPVRWEGRGRERGPGGEGPGRGTQRGGRAGWGVAILALLLLAACNRAVDEFSEDPPPLPVTLETVERMPFQPTLVLLGVVRPAGEAQVIVPSAGRLRYPERFRDGLSSGVAVRSGEVVARLFSAEAEQELAEAKLRLEAAGTELERYQRAFEAGVVPAAQVAQHKSEADLARQRLEGARQRRSSLDLRSPVAGWLLVERRLPPESDVQAGTVLARVAAGGALRIEARAAAADRSRLREGLAVQLMAPGAAEPAGGGVIREISPVLDAGGTVPVVVEVTAGAALPVPGEGVELRVELDPRPQALTVPEESLVENGAVYVNEGGMARRRAVTTGLRSGGRVEVLTGLSPGDKVVVGGAALLSEGAKVTQVEEENRP